MSDKATGTVKWLQDDITKARKLVISRHTDEKKQPIVWLFFFIAS